MKLFCHRTMSRYFNSEETSSNGNHQSSSSSSRITLPEFVRFSQPEQTVDTTPTERIEISTSRNQHRETRSPLNFRDDRSRRSRPIENGNDQRRRSSRESHLSSTSYNERHPRHRSRSQSPRYSSPLPKERNHVSIFERMNSPPPRRFNDGSRKSHETNFFRTIAIEDFQNFDDTRHQRQAYNDVQYLAEPIRRSLTDESYQLQEMRERLRAAESHVNGLELTVRNYEREINKLRLIVNNLIEDFEVVQSRFR